MPLKYDCSMIVLFSVLLLLKFEPFIKVFARLSLLLLHRPDKRLIPLSRSYTNPLFRSRLRGTNSLIGSKCVTISSSVLLIYNNVV